MAVLHGLLAFTTLYRIEWVPSLWQKSTVRVFAVQRWRGLDHYTLQWQQRLSKTSPCSLYLSRERGRFKSSMAYTSAQCSSDTGQDSYTAIQPQKHKPPPNLMFNECAQVLFYFLSWNVSPVYEKSTVNYQLTLTLTCNLSIIRWDEFVLVTGLYSYCRVPLTNILHLGVQRPISVPS